jgi:hypothetical protein
MNSLPIPVNWSSRDAKGDLYRLFDIQLETLRCYGVYVIYQQSVGLFPPVVLKVGQGQVADRFAAHRQLNVLKQRTGVLATWTPISPIIIDGVERYLADRYQPLYGEAFPAADPVPVSLPF